nr:uncharacterized protein [Tanacetum cinerariifolium]
TMKITSHEQKTKGRIINVSSGSHHFIRKSSDIIMFMLMDESSVLCNLQYRYHHGVIYTMEGPVQFAINPFKDVSVSKSDVIMAYKEKILDSPYVYAIADAAYSDMMRVSSLLFTSLCYNNVKNEYAWERTFGVLMKIDLMDKGTNVVIEKKGDGASGSGGSVIDGLPIVNKITHTKLDGSIFFAWSKTIRIYLHSIIKGSHLKYNPHTDETKDQWLQNEARLFLMIKNSIEPYVIPLLDHYNVCMDFHRGEQQDLSLIAYVMEFKKMHKELNSLLPISADMKVMQKQREQIAVMSFLTSLRPEFDSLICQFLNETKISSLQDTFARVIRNETLQSPYTLASNSALVNRDGFQGGSRNSNSDRVGDSQGFNSYEVECYYCHELGHTTRNCKKFLAKKNGSFVRASTTSDKTVTISAEEYARLKGSVYANSSTSTAATAIVGTESVEKLEAFFPANVAALALRKSSPRVTNEAVQKAAAALRGSNHRHATNVSARLDTQQKKLNLPILLTTKSEQ